MRPPVTKVLCLGLFLLTAACQSAPGWTRNSEIDAGEVKVINFNVAPAGLKLAGSSFNYNQLFNKTDFTVIPRVVIAQLSFAFLTSPADEQSLMGYNISMGSTSTLGFSFGVTTLGVNIIGLHFIYLAVSPAFDHIYFMQNYFLGCTLGTS